MTIYLIIIFLFVVFLYFRIKSPLLILVVLVFLSSFRNLSVGIDTQSYYNQFRYDIQSDTLFYYLFKLEPGWLLLNLWIKEIFGEFSIILFSSCLLTILPISYVFRRATNMPILAFFIYFLLFYYFFSFSLIRQAIAISFFVLGVYFFSNNRKVEFHFSILFGSLFHYSIIILYPVVFLAERLKINFFWSICILFSTFFVGFFEVFGDVRHILAYLPFEKYSNYIDYETEEGFNRLTNYIFIFPKTLFFLFSVYVQRIANYSIINLELFLKLFFVGVVLLNLFLSVPQLSRFAWYLTFFEIIIIVNIFDSVKGKIKILSIGFYSFYVLVYFLYYVRMNRFGISPFEFNFVELFRFSN